MSNFLTVHCEWVARHVPTIDDWSLSHNSKREYILTIMIIWTKANLVRYATIDIALWLLLRKRENGIIEGHQN